MSNWDLRVEVKEIPISLLSENTGQIPDVPKNPRKITKEKFDALCESIRQSPEMKMLDEVKVYPYNGRFVVISGNHRYKAYRKLGWVNVLCKVLPEDTPKEKLREYVMKENMHYAENPVVSQLVHVDAHPRRLRRIMAHAAVHRVHHRRCLGLLRIFLADRDVRPQPRHKP